MARAPDPNRRQHAVERPGVEETAKALEVSARTVKREWSFARAWLYNALRETES